MTVNTQVKDLSTTITEEVKRIIYKVMEFPNDKVLDFNLTPSNAFGPSFEDCVEIIMLCEDSFGLHIDNQTADKYLTSRSSKPVKDFISLIMFKCLDKELNGSGLRDSNSHRVYHTDRILPAKGEQVTEKQVPVEIMYEQSVWLNAVKDAESAVMRNLPVLPGGRNSGEDILEYRDRCLAGLNAAVQRFVYAEKKYKEANARAAETIDVCTETPVPRKRKSKKQ